MLSKIREFFSPRDLREALALLHKYQGEVALVGGGLDLSWRPRKEVRVLVGLDRVHLSGIQEEADGLHIGAMVTLRELKESPILGNYFHGFIPLVVRQVATPLLRGIITLGGLIAQAYPWSDLLPVLLGLEARLKLFDGREQTLTLKEFYALNFRERVSKSIITELILPLKPRGVASYRRFTRTEVDIPLLNVFLLLQFQVKKVKQATVLVGGRPGPPEHLKEVETLLKGGGLSQARIEEAVELARNNVRVEGDFRLGKSARSYLTGTLLREGLEEIKRNDVA